jgi:hypothetical protein
MFPPRTPGRSRMFPARNQPPARRSVPARRRSRPRVEALEDRLTPSVLSVTTTADVVDPNDGALSLREAVAQANQDPPGDVIRIPGGVYKLTHSRPLYAGAVTGTVELDLTNSMSLVGDGPAATVIDAGNGGRAFSIVFNGSEVGTVEFVGLTVRKGNVGFPPGHGGSSGGGIYASNGVVRLRDCTVTGNNAVLGGGIWVGNGTGGAGSLEVINSTISGNTAIDGGGIGAYGMDVALVGSTLSGNSAANGSGLLTYPSAGGTHVRVTNSTISGNTARYVGGVGSSDTSGGGLRIAAGDTLALIHATVTANSAVHGGGISNSGTVYLTNTLVAGNTLPAPVFGSPTPSGPDLDGTFIGADFNLIGDASGSSGLVDGQGGDQVGPVAGQPIDPKLGPLADNGGPTFTHALLPGSPAPDAARDGLAPTDQRLAPRPQGAHSDIGAFEGPLGPVTPLPASAFEQAPAQDIALGQFRNGDGTEPVADFQVHINWAASGLIPQLVPNTQHSFTAPMPPGIPGTWTGYYPDPVGISWGDGTLIPGGTPGPDYYNGTVSLANGVYTVLGYNGFLDEGVRTVSVDVSRAGTYLFSFQTTLTVMQELLPDGTRGTANQRYVAELYHDLLQRPPDGPGLAAWSALLDQGVSRAEVAYRMMTDPGNEHRGVVVRRIYRELVGQDPDYSELTRWITELALGASDEQVAFYITTTRPFWDLKGTDPITRFYIYALGRQPDPIGRDAWGSVHGFYPPNVLEGILQSPEHREHQAWLWYHTYLGRAPEPGGAEAWASALAAGLSDEAALAAFLGEPTVGEFYNKTAP